MRASPGELRDRCYSVAVNSDGHVAAIGHIAAEDEGENLWVEQYTPEGEREWTWVLNGDANDDEEGWSILAVEDDQWLVSGYVATPDADTDAWLGRLDAAGSLVWQATWGGSAAPWIDQARDATLAANGDVVAIGYATVEPGAHTDIWIQRRSPDGQTIRWTQRRPGLEANGLDRALGLERLPDGGFVGVGRNQTSEQRLYWVERFDDNGDTVWLDQGAPGSETSAFSGVAVTPQGEIVLAGWKELTPGDADMWLQRRSLDGEVLWEDFVASPAGDKDNANVIVVDERGGFIVGGELGAGSGSTDAWIRRYGPDGAEMWTTTFSGLAGDRDTTWGLALAPDGSLYACGYESVPGSEWDTWVRRLTP